MVDKQTEILKDLISPKSSSEGEGKGENFKSQILREGQKAKQGTNHLYIFAVVVFILGLIGGGYFLYQSFIKNDGETGDSKRTETVIPVEESQNSPTPTPEAELDRVGLKVQILNGSGTPGMAGEAQEYLESLGYDDINTGNADAYDYKETVISIKPDKEEYLDLITEDLAGEYTVADEIKELDEESAFDIVVTIGID